MRTRFRAWLPVSFLVAVVWLGGCVTSRAGDVPAGLPVAQSAPDFTLKDQNGRDRTLADLRGDAYLAVVFHRSADW